MVDTGERHTTSVSPARPEELAPASITALMAPTAGPLPRMSAPPEHLAPSDRRRVPPFRLGHHPALDGIRGAGLLLVVGAHLGLIIWPDARRWFFPPHAYVAMDVFFVLSGFLITSLLLGAFDRHGHVQLRQFLWRRGTRIVPALLMLLAALLAAAVIGYGPYAPGSLLADEAFMLSLISNWWPGDHLPQEMSHTWSLAVEGQFYLLWSLVAAAVLGLVRRRPRELLVALALAGAAAVAVTRAMRLADGYSAFLLYVETTARLDGPLIGAAIGVAYASGWFDRVPRRHAAILGTVGLVGLLLVPLALDQSDNAFLFNGGFTVQALFGAALVVGMVLLPHGNWLNRLFGFRPLVVAGTISYSVYLWHVPIFVVVERDLDNLPIGVQVAGALLASFLIGALSYRYVERPFLHRLTRRKPRPAPA